MAGRISRQPGDDPDTIHWRGDQREDLPSRLSDIPEAYRHTPPPIPTSETRRNEPPPVVNEPRRYANPLGVATRAVNCCPAVKFNLLSADPPRFPPLRLTLHLPGLEPHHPCSRTLN